MKHHTCCCPGCTPPRPAPCPGFLLPRVIASGRGGDPRSCLQLQVEGLPCQAQPPYTLTSVSPAGEPSWEPLTGAQGLSYCVSIPLVCQVRDACGCLYCGHAHITTQVCLTPCRPAHECWRSCMMVLPCVRLICAQSACEPCFTAQLEVLVEAYLLRWEPCGTAQTCKPRCPELPLYPHPCYP